ncbi:MAG TPA: hypothetical protein VFA75_18735 [Nevskia sp.]|nr:hypothetical protein [Nevskia sp.]
MRRSLRNLLRLGLLAAVAGAATGCVVDPGYGYYGPAYYPSTVYVEPGPVYYGGYYHGYHRGYGYHHWH